MTDSIDHTPDPRRYITKAEELEAGTNETKHPDDLSDDKTNRIVLGSAVVGLLGLASAIAVRRLNNQKEEQ